VAKKVVSLTIDPALVKQVDAYAVGKKMSRSAAIEAAITSLLTLNSPIATAENSLVQSDNCVFASPASGTAIFY
jgi:metal-responsive CopG/Arc/MetJ family transcriptional regulator